jgi:hypothetical protein
MKTAVEWLFEQLDISQGYESAIKILEQAKEMEKEQIIQAITKTIIGSNVIYGNEYPEVIHTAEQYYNETFKSE